MRMTLKRVTAWMLTLMMIVSCVPASAVDGSVVDFSSSTSAYDVMPLSNGATEPTASENITVTFVINNPNYTSDPGSNYTHITSKSKIEGGELTYTSWSDRYQVTGTGKVCSISIPAGTSVSENGSAFPELTVTNIGNTNSLSYASPYSWVTAGGMVCSMYTVFEEDTTLYLQLYETGATSYHIDYICGAHNHSISSGATFNLGQSVSAADIASATAKANVFESQWCTEGPASGKRLAKWQLKVTASGEMVDLVAGMPITNDYVDPQYGSAIKAYAIWEENTDIPVTVTFLYTKTVDGVPTTETLTTRELFSGDTLGELPTPEIPEGSTFVGWQYGTDAEGNPLYATADMTITENMTFTAVFSTPVTATFQYSKTVDGEQTLVTLETRPLTAGAALGTLPTPEIPEGSTFVGWQYGTDAEGNPLYATPDMIITEDMVFTAVFTEIESGKIFLYDVQPDGSTNDEFAIDILAPVTMTLAQAIEYSDGWIDDDTMLSECVWRTAINGELADLNVQVSAENPISLYTHIYQIILTLTPQMQAAFGMRSLVDVSEGEDGTITMTITAREGEQLTAEDFITEDGVNLMDYVWMDDNQPMDLQTLIDAGVTSNITATSDGTLAPTDVTLTLNLTLDGEKKTYTITKAEGEALAATDFVIDGLNLTKYIWTDATNTTVSLEDLVGTTLAQDTTLTSNGTLNTSLEVTSNRVNFYVYLDNEPYKVATKTVTSYKTSDANRRYISADTLAAVYGEYGFSASQLQAGTKYFPHTDENGGTIWADASVLENNGLYYSPIVGNGNNTDVYYLPEQWTLTTSSTGKENSTIVEANGFYSMRVEDPAGLVYSKDMLPERQVVYNGGSVSITVQPTPDGAEWECVGLETNTTLTPTVNADGSLTYSVSDIQQPYVIRLKIANDIVVVYNLALPHIPDDEEYGKPTIQGEEEYGLLLTPADANAYVLLAPSRGSYFYTYGKYLGEATFLGWMVNGELKQPGDTLDLSGYVGQTVTLTAQWDEKLGGTADIWNSPMINFFVALNAVSEGTKEWIGNTDTSDFTSSVYTSNGNVTGRTAVDQRLYVGDAVHLAYATQYHVLGGTSGTDLNANHTEIVRELTAGHTKTGNDGEEYTFTSSFPSEETVLKNIRRMIQNGDTTIRINGREIQPEEMTTSNFTIKWYVFKFDTSDGWHIDGILVAKSSKMIVTKTFAGDEAAISAIRTGFTINVEGESGAVHQGKELHVTNATSMNGSTYTWEVPVDIYYNYTVTENNYKYNENLATYKSQYRVRHSEVDSQNTGWTNYTDSSNITVTGRGYNESDDERLQVDFLNTYTVPGTVIVQKIDAVTGNLLPNVSFRIGGMREDESHSALQMYHKVDSHYTADASQGGTLTDIITTDASGQAYLWIGGGSYWLEEMVPTGYDDPGRITIELEGDADNSYKVVEITSASAANDTANKSFVSVGGKDGLTLTVKNYSRQIDLKVIKDWINDENKPVTIQLYRNGKPLGSNYTVTLDGSEKWTHTFTGLPLYADGGLAQYSIREEMIGDFMYSEQFPSGYQYYDVHYSGMQYLDASGSATTDMTQVKTIALEVGNDRNHGSLSIAKVDENAAGLSGAEFWLYKASAAGSTVPTVSKDGDGHNVLSGLTPVKQVTSAANGVVSFGNVEADRYYLIEHSSPEGYIGSDLLYLVQFDGSSATMQYYNNGVWTTLNQLRVTNTSQTMDIPVTKIWEDAENTGKRPTSISVTLTGMVGDKVVVTRSVRITTENSDVNMGDDGNAVPSSTWSYTFENLPQYSGGEKITYTLIEAPVAGYESSIVDPNPNDEEVEFTITNTLLSNITYTVSKLVDGNFADRNKTFAFTAVVRNSAGEAIKTETFSLKHGGSYAIVGIPYGATVEVTENPDGYEAEYLLGQTRVGGATYISDPILDSSLGVTFINTKNVTIDTGVDLDGLPYTMLLLSVAGIGVALLLARRRRNEA